MKIGICDDDPQDCLRLEAALSELGREDEITRFANGFDLLRALRNGQSFSCLFLDILMPDINGIQLASRIQEEFPEASIRFAFITASKEYAIEAFARRAVHYLVKPIQTEDVAEALSRVSERHAQRFGLTIRNGSTRRFVYLDEIAVCESSNHSVRVKLVSGETLTHSQTMKTLQQQLGSDFLPVARGVIVNFDYIAAMEKRACVLTDGRKILLSRKNLDEIHHAYEELVFSRLIERGSEFFVDA